MFMVGPEYRGPSNVHVSMLFHALFGTADQKEGMTAFVEKRPGNWTGK